MEAGIIGLPYVGKTTVFNAMTALGVSGEGAANRPNIGVAPVPDDRLGQLAEYVKTRKIVPATVQVVDVAGLSAGASEGKGAGNKFLSHVRNVDALLHVVRCYEDADVPHVNGSIDPVRDAEEVEMELTIADLEVVENAVGNAQRKARTGDKTAKMRLGLLERLASALSEGTPASTVQMTEDEQREARSYALLTAKPVLYVANIGEDDLSGSSAHVQKLEAYAKERGGLVVPVCAKLEAELAELDDAERAEMLEGMGLGEPALNVLTRAAYNLLGLQSFFTAGDKEIKAWTVRIGSTAPEAAGEIHSDIQRGFIRVEVYSVEDMLKHKSEQAIKQAGRLRVEGKSYVMQEGDVCHFLFNV